MNELGYVAGALTLIAFLPQSIKTIRTQKARDLSLLTYIFLVVSAFLWAAYGYGTHKPAIYITNTITCFLSTLILILIIMDRAE